MPTLVFAVVCVRLSHDGSRLGIATPLSLHIHSPESKFKERVFTLSVGPDSLTPSLFPLRSFALAADCTTVAVVGGYTTRMRVFPLADRRSQPAPLHALEGVGILRAEASPSVVSGWLLLLGHPAAVGPVTIAKPSL